jgi:hypothetical protein
MVESTVVEQWVSDILLLTIGYSYNAFKEHNME